MEDSTSPPPRLLLRLVICLGLTVSALVYDLEIGLVVAGVTGIWVLLGVSERVHRAAHQSAGTAASAAASDPEPGASPKVAAPASDLVECPRCSLLLSPKAATCACGWAASDAAPPA